MQTILHKLRKTIEKLYVKKLQKHFFKIRMKMLYLQLHTGTIRCILLVKLVCICTYCTYVVRRTLYNVQYLDVLFQ